MENNEYKSYYDYLNRYNRYTGQKKTKPIIDGDSERHIDVPEIIGIGYCQKLLEYILPIPSQYPAANILNSLSEINNLSTNVCKDGVFVDGTLFRVFSYQCYEGVFSYKYNNTKHRGSHGCIRYISIDLPFSCFIEVPGALPGDTVKFIHAGIDDSLKFCILEDPITGTGSTIKEYKKLNVKDMIKIELELTRIAHIAI
ncbi:MAG: DUF3794 domain-containing protein [Clostridia bacterium]|nr:DUF3794 domain-containing protein [Clostridia bacterium]